MRVCAVGNCEHLIKLCSDEYRIGMYDTLRPELLTATPAQRAEMTEDPTHVVSWSLFHQNQVSMLQVYP